MSETIEVLGCKIRAKSSDNDLVRTEDVIKLVNDEALAIKKINPAMADAHVAVLVALKIASDKLGLEANYKNDVDSLERTMLSALELVEEISPTVV